MLANRSSAIVLAATLMAGTAFSPCYSVAPSSKAPLLTLEEIRAKRQSVRDDLMVPSLQGIRGLAYVVVGTEDGGQKLDPVAGSKLAQLKIPIAAMRSMSKGFKPIDAILEIKVLKSTENHDMVHLTVTQWCTLMRAPQLKVRAVTYADSLSAKPDNVKAVISELTSQFVINFLRANKK